MISSFVLVVAMVACGSPPDEPRGPDAGMHSTCGDNMCESGETPMSCPADCHANPCGNGTCDNGETPASCPADCHSSCGNGTCDSGETPTSCPADCHSSCGNGTCDSGETPQSCPADCHQPTCGNSVCESGETVQSCPSDCAATMITDNRSSRTVYRLFVVPCGSTTWGTNWLSPYSLPPNYYFTLSKIPPGCYWFRADIGSDAWVWQDTTGYNFDAGHTFTWTLH